MRLLVQCFTTFLVLICLPGSAGIYYHGKVQSSSGIPISGAQVVFPNLPAVTTDSDGEFVLVNSSVAVSKASPQKLTRFIEFNNSKIQFSKCKDRRISIYLYDARGRVSKLYNGGNSIKSEFTYDLFSQSKLSSGMYILKIMIDNESFPVRFTSVNSSIIWPSSNLALSIGEKKLVGSAMIRSLQVSASGYEQSGFTVPEDTAIGLLFTLYAQGITKPQSVTWGAQTETKTFKYQPTYNPLKIYWLSHQPGPNPNTITAAWYKPTGSALTASKSYTAVTLDNGLIKVVVAPELGMRVIRVQDLTKGAREMFAIMDNPVNGLGNVAWQDMGGIEPSYPFFEAGTPLINDKGVFDNRAGYFVEDNPDGSKSVVMNLWLSHHQDVKDIAMLGRYGDRPLVGKVTVWPGSSRFSVSYIADNVNSMRRSNRIWNDVLFPAESNMQYLYPTKWLMDHNAARLFENNTATPPLTSFALYPAYPFCGTYYPTSDANHLRIANPEKNPGMKLYHDGTKIEFWGSTNPMFEAPDTFTNAYEPLELKHDFYMVRGIGKVAYANEYVAISISGQSFKIVAPSLCKASVFEYNTNSQPIIDNQVLGPSNVLNGSFSQGLRVVVDGKEVCNVKLPLVLPDNKEKYARVKMMADLSGGAASFNNADWKTRAVVLDSCDARWRFNYELEGPYGKDLMMNSLAVLPAVDKVSSNDDPDVLISMANAAYRHGAFDVVEKYLGFVGNRRPSETAYLRALIAWEKSGKTGSGDFTNAPIEANYFKAMLKIRAGDKGSAITLLSELLNQRPNAIRPRLMRAFLTKDLQDALYCKRLVPGSLELWAVLKELNYPSANTNLANLLKQDAIAGTRLDDFLGEIKNGNWRHEPRIEYQSIWFKEALLPEFPSTLKY